MPKTKQIYISEYTRKHSYHAINLLMEATDVRFGL